MEHEALAGDGEHDFAPSWRARFESHPVSGSERGAHREAARDQLKGARRKGGAEQLYELGPGDSPRGRIQ
jgi:hypothetical protein